MSTLTGRDQSALLVVNVQNDVVGNAWRRDEVVGRTAGLVENPRSAQIPVVWVQHHEQQMTVGSEGAVIGSLFDEPVCKTCLI